MTDRTKCYLDRTKCYLVVKLTIPESLLEADPEDMPHSALEVAYDLGPDFDAALVKGIYDEMALLPEDDGGIEATVIQSWSEKPEVWLKKTKTRR